MDGKSDKLKKDFLQSNKGHILLILKPCDHLINGLYRCGYNMFESHDTYYECVNCGSHRTKQGGQEKEKLKIRPSQYKIMTRLIDQMSEQRVPPEKQEILIERIKSAAIKSKLRSDDHYRKYE